MSKQAIIVALGSLFLLVGCEVPELSLVDSATGGPRSNFVEHRAIVRANVGEPLPIESYHIGQKKLDSVEISINDRPIGPPESDGIVATFPYTQATVVIENRAQPILIDSPKTKPQLVTIMVGPKPLYTHSVRPKYKTSTWSYTLIWVGHIPGTYDLKLQATDSAEPDKDGQPGEPIVQRIEVE